MGINTETNNFQDSLANLVNDGLAKIPVCNVRLSLMLALEKVVSVERTVMEREKEREKQEDKEE